MSYSAAVLLPALALHCQELWASPDAVRKECGNYGFRHCLLPQPTDILTQVYEHFHTSWLFERELLELHTTDTSDYAKVLEKGILKVRMALNYSALGFSLLLGERNIGQKLNWFISCRVVANAYPRPLGFYAAGSYCDSSVHRLPMQGMKPRNEVIQAQTLIAQALRNMRQRQFIKLQQEMQADPLKALRSQSTGKPLKQFKEEHWNQLTWRIGYTSLIDLLYDIEVTDRSLDRFECSNLLLHLRAILGCLQGVHEYYLSCAVGNDAYHRMIPKNGYSFVEQRYDGLPFYFTLFPHFCMAVLSFNTAGSPPAPTPGPPESPPSKADKLVESGGAEDVEPIADDTSDGGQNLTLQQDQAFAEAEPAREPMLHTSPGVPITAFSKVEEPAPKVDAEPLTGTVPLPTPEKVAEQNQALAAYVPSGAALAETSDAGGLLQWGEIIAKSGLFPKITTPQAAVVSLGLVRNLGLMDKEFLALSQLHIIEGKPVLSLNLIQFMLGRAGVVLRVEHDYFYCTNPVTQQPDFLTRVVFTDKHKYVNGVMYETWFSEMVESKVTTKDNWKRMPRKMLRKDVIVSGARLLYPEILGGVYEHGEMIDAGKMEGSTYTID